MHWTLFDSCAVSDWGKGHFSKKSSHQKFHICMCRWPWDGCSETSDSAPVPCWPPIKRFTNYNQPVTPWLIVFTSDCIWNRFWVIQGKSPVLFSSNIETLYSWVETNSWKANLWPYRGYVFFLIGERKNLLFTLSLRQRFNKCIHLCCVTAGYPYDCGHVLQPLLVHPLTGLEV